ncbi:MAG: aminopeptidase P family protein [Patescibacteria group bacterium]
MMSTHQQKIKKLLTEEACDALLVINSEESGQPTTQYLSGFSGSSSVLLMSSKKNFLTTDSRYDGRAQKEAAGFTVIIFKSGDTLSGILKTLVRKLNIQKVLIDGSETFYSSVENIKTGIPEIEVISKKGIFQKLRIVKDSREIALIRKAAEIAVKGFLRLIPEIKIGSSEKYLAARLEVLCREEGADSMSFDTIIASGKNTALPHSSPSDKKLQTGDLVLIDWGVKYKGYCSDLTRTLAMGKISPRLKTIYETVLKSQELACSKARAGITGEKLDAICRVFLTKRGFGKYFIHATGHGIGLEVHELPIISQKQADPLPVGAVVTCEPGIYIPNIGGVRIEDDLVLTKKGVINLSASLSKKLLIL